MRLEAQHSAPPPDDPDLTWYVRPFTAQQITAIINRIERRVAAGKVAQLKPETAHLVARALRRYLAEPSRDSIVREICGIRGGCEQRCLGCIGKANAIMTLFDGRKVRDEI